MADRFSALADLTWNNPVLVKEFRTRMRGARAYWVLLIYVLLLTLVVGGTYLSWYAADSSRDMSHQAASATGRLLFQILFSLQAGLVALITPAITAGAITIEREQQTYAMLATCGLRPQHIIWGKLLAAVAFVALLLTSSLPLVSLSFLLGGVSPGEVFGTYVSLALSAFVFGSLGILCSASLRATAAATVATYAAVITIFFVTLFYGVLPAEAPFRSVNAATAIYHSVDMEPFFRTRLPSWLIGITLNLLMGLLFANLAMTKLEYFDDRRPIAVRGLATALWTMFLLFVAGNVFGQPGGLAVAGPPGYMTFAKANPGRDLAVFLLGLGLGLMLAVLPIFTTGEWEPRDGREREGDAEHPRVPFSAPQRVRQYLSGMLPHGMFRAELPSGTPLMGLWLVIACGLVVGGFAVIGKPGLFPIDSLALVILAIGVIAAFTALGNFLSVALPDRKAAMVLTYLAMAALCLLPLLGSLAWLSSDRTGGPRLAWQFLYLSPLMAFAEAGDVSNAFWTNTPPMLFRQTPFWFVTSIIYAGLALLLFSLTLRQLRKGA
jgi:ABC-type transport system involved in multi-copper enzyme maturation permease subunit